MNSRRDVLAGLAGAALPGWSVQAAEATAEPTAEPIAELNLHDPATNLRAFIKLRGSLCSEPVFDLVRGRVYGLVGGQAARPLFKTVGAQRSIYTRRSAFEYSAVTRYIGLLLDWQTEQPLARWTNPYNGKDCPVPVTRYGPSEVRFLGDRMVPASLAPDPAQPGTRPWFVLGSVVHMREQILMPAPEMPLFPKADLMTFSGELRQLADPNLDTMPSRLSFTAVETWRPWMRMDAQAQAGTLWWQVAGVKLEGPGAYSPVLREQLQAVDPTFFDIESDA
ncbi:MAG: DUF1838 family protein [Gammaproteobacteria bacterium]|nr:DUF1838 family protein [Gammaproteobacteria bacterium]